MAEAHQKQIELYLPSDGKAPFSDWLEVLKDGKARAAIRVRIDRVRLGNMGDCKPTVEEVSELRIDFGPGYRVYFGQEGARVIVLLCGGDKSTQKADIKRKP
jgi:putative addiction module killer protein